MIGEVGMMGDHGRPLPLTETGRVSASNALRNRGVLVLVCVLAALLGFSLCTGGEALAKPPGPAHEPGAGPGSPGPPTSSKSKDQGPAAQPGSMQQGPVNKRPAPGPATHNPNERAAGPTQRDPVLREREHRPARKVGPREEKQLHRGQPAQAPVHREPVARKPGSQKPTVGPASAGRHPQPQPGRKSATHQRSAPPRPQASGAKPHASHHSAGMAAGQETAGPPERAYKPAPSPPGRGGTHPPGQGFAGPPERPQPPSEQGATTGPKNDGKAHGPQAGDKFHQQPKVQPGADNKPHGLRSSKDGELTRPDRPPHDPAGLSAAGPSTGETPARRPSAQQPVTTSHPTPPVAQSGAASSHRHHSVRPYDGPALVRDAGAGGDAHTGNAPPPATPRGGTPHVGDGLAGEPARLASGSSLGSMTIEPDPLWGSRSYLVEGTEGVAGLLPSDQDGLSVLASWGGQLVERGPPVEFPLPSSGFGPALGGAATGAGTSGAWTAPLVAVLALYLLIPLRGPLALARCAFLRPGTVPRPALERPG